MFKSQGSEGIALVECISPKYRKYRVRWAVKARSNEEGEKDGVDCMEEEFNHKPSVDEVKSVILEWMNSEIEEKIRSGFEFEGSTVWLSQENQFNYKAAYDLAVQSGGANLPIVFKFGETASPVYRTFESVEDISSFYSQAMAYINGVLSDGWKEKDAMDWSVYEELLK